MNFTRREIQTMCLAGTVSVPQSGPPLARLSIVQCDWPAANGTSRPVLQVEHQISPKLRITRNFHLSDVAAVFMPDDSNNINLECGTWLLENEIAPHITTLERNSEHGPLGVAYVREQAATLMRVDVGMTAAESVDYYPPLPGDCSNDHYRIPACAKQVVGYEEHPLAMMACGGVHGCF